MDDLLLNKMTNYNVIYNYWFEQIESIVQNNKQYKIKMSGSFFLPTFIGPLFIYFVLNALSLLLFSIKRPFYLHANNN